MRERERVWSMREEREKERRESFEKERGERERGREKERRERVWSRRDERGEREFGVGEMREGREREREREQWLLGNAAQVFNRGAAVPLPVDRVSRRSGGKAEPPRVDEAVAVAAREDAGDGWPLLEAVIVFR